MRHNDDFVLPSTRFYFILSLLATTRINADGRHRRKWQLGKLPSQIFILLLLYIYILSLPQSSSFSSGGSATAVDLDLLVPILSLIYIMRSWDGFVLYYICTYNPNICISNLIIAYLLSLSSSHSL